MQDGGMQGSDEHPGGIVHPGGLSVGVGGKVARHPWEIKVNELLICSPARICAEGDLKCCVVWASHFRMLLTGRACPLKPEPWTAFALSPPTLGSLKWAKIVASAAQSILGGVAHWLANAAGIVKPVVAKLGSWEPC